MVLISQHYNFYIEENSNEMLFKIYILGGLYAMSEKQDSSCASQQEKEKKANNAKTKHTKKTHKKD